MNERARMSTLEVLSKVLLCWLVVLGLQLGRSIGLAAEFSYPDFWSTGGLSLVGDATAQNGVLRLTPSWTWKKGAAWYATQVPVSLGFETTFQFRIQGPYPADRPSFAADGITFAVQRVGSGAIGDEGIGIGYRNIGQSSLAVELDTWYNRDVGDPDWDHIGIDYAGSVSHGLGVVSLGSPTALLDTHSIRITYDGSLLAVYFDQANTPTLQATVNLASILGGTEAWVGFTAATGANYATHELLSWQFRSIPEPEQYSLVAGLLALLSGLCKRVAGRNISRSSVR